MPEAETYYVRTKTPGGRVRYEEAELPFDIIGVEPPVSEEPEKEEEEVLDLTAHNQKKLDYYASEGQAGSFAGVTCPSPHCDGLMFFRSETIVSNQLNLPAKREVSCRVCGRTGTMMI